MFSKWYLLGCTLQWDCSLWNIYMFVENSVSTYSRISYNLIGGLQLLWSYRVCFQFLFVQISLSLSSKGSEDPYLTLSAQHLYKIVEAASNHLLKVTSLTSDLNRSPAHIQTAH